MQKLQLPTPREIAVAIAVGIVMALAAVLFAGRGAHAQELSSESAPLTIGIYKQAPFVIEKDGVFKGMAIDLWEAIAERHQYAFTYVPYDNVGALLDVTAAGKIDVAVGNISITSERAEILDFTHPWFDNGMRVLVDDDRIRGFQAVWSGLYDAGFLKAYLWIGLIIVAATIGYTLFDRRFDPAYPRGWMDGIAEGFYTVMSLATSGRAPHRKNLFGWAGRFWQGLWLACGIAVVAYVTSSVTSVMTTLSLSGQISSVADLNDKITGVIANSTAQDYAAEQGLTIRAYPAIDDIAAALSRNDIAAAIGDAAVLEYYVFSHPEQALDVVGPLFHPDKYGFAVPRQSPLRRPMTAALLALEGDGSLRSLYELYFGNDPT